MKVTQRDMNRLIVTLLIMGLLILASTVVAAEVEYPIKPVYINVGSAPGASASVSAHILVEGIQKYLPRSQPFIINYKPGASSMLANDYFMKQPADGYNLVWMTQDTPLNLAKEPQKFSFSLKDFSYIGLFAYVPYTLSVNNESPFKTFEEFIDSAKKHPGEMTLSTPGIASGGHLTAELLMKEAGVKLIHVPFPSGTPATLAMLGGHVTCTVMSIGTLIPHIKGGRTRVLVVFDGKRYPDLPDAPTCKEKGYEVVGYHYLVLIAKKGTPKSILDTLSNLFRQVTSDPTAQSALTKAGFIPLYLGAEETEKYVYQYFETSREVFGKLGLVGK